MHLSLKVLNKSARQTAEINSSKGLKEEPALEAQGQGFRKCGALKVSCKITSVYMEMKRRMRGKIRRPRG